MHPLAIPSRRGAALLLVHRLAVFLQTGQSIEREVGQAAAADHRVLADVVRDRAVDRVRRVPAALFHLTAAAVLEQGVRDAHHPVV